MTESIDLSLAPRVLVAEDEAIVALDVSTSLEALGYEVVAVVHTGEEAVESAKRLSPDVALLDVRMPGLMDGIDAGKAINERHGIPIVYLTAYSDNQTLQRAKESGPYGYLVKPIDEREVRTTIELALYRHNMERMVQADARQWEDLYLRDPAGRAICSRNGTVLEANPALARILDFETPEAALAHAIMPWEITNPEESGVMEQLETYGVLESIELNLTRRDDGILRVLGAAQILSVRWGRVWEISWSFIPLQGER